LASTGLRPIEETVPIKGNVQRKLTWVVTYIIQENFHSQWTTSILYFNLKGTCSLNRKKTVSAA
jgi:hypothetical protein